MQKNILNISKSAIISLHTAILLAQSKKPIKTAEISKVFGFSINHLSKIMQHLCKAGFFKAIRGPKGGFVLAKKPSAIKLLDIYEQIEGKLNLSVCLIDAKKCLRDKCILGNMIVKINRELKNNLNKTLLQITKHSRIKI